MPAIIHCVRHAQGFHNLGVEFHGLPDPKLTPVGVDQCLTLRNTLWQNQSHLSLVTASPLSRTIHTAFLVFGDALSNGKAQPKILAIPDAQETSDFPCDTGSDADVLANICKDENWPVDLSLVKDGWNMKTLGGRYSPATHAVKTRARDARRFLRQKARELEKSGDNNPEIVLVSHGGYLHYFTEDWEYADKLLGTGWENCETRSYNFEFDDDDSDAHLVETTESRHRRGIDHPMLSKDKQMNLFNNIMQHWKDQGLKDDSVSGDDQDEPDKESVARKTEIDVVA